MNEAEYSKAYKCWLMFGVGGGNPAAAGSDETNHETKPQALLLGEI